MRETLWERFHDKIIPEAISGCWLWDGAVKESGHGVIGVGGRRDGVARAHRVAWELYVGKIPANGNVLHRCGNAGCVNPKHLYIGTLKENARDTVAMGRLKLPNNRGERARWAKLTESAALEVLQSKGGPRGTGAWLARKFGVSRSAIYEIWRGKNWASLNAI